MNITDSTEPYSLNAPLPLKMTTRDKIQMLCTVMGYQVHFGQDYHQWQVMIVGHSPFDLRDDNDLNYSLGCHHYYRTVDSAFSALQWMSSLQQRQT